MHAVLTLVSKYVRRFVLPLMFDQYNPIIKLKENILNWNFLISLTSCIIIWILWSFFYFILLKTYLIKISFLLKLVGLQLLRADNDWTCFEIIGIYAAIQIEL